MRKRRKEYPDDDGRTIANMNVEGMPWYAPKRSDVAPGEQPPLSKAESRAVTRGVLLAALSVALVFILGFTVFILFCVFVWFK